MAFYRISNRYLGQRDELAGGASINMTEVSPQASDNGASDQTTTTFPDSTSEALRQPHAATGDGAEVDEGRSESATADNGEEEEGDEDDDDEDEDEDDDDEEDEEDDEPKLKYARLTSQLGAVYRNGDATSTFLVAGDKMVRYSPPMCLGTSLTCDDRSWEHTTGIFRQLRRCPHSLLLTQAAACPPITLNAVAARLPCPLCIRYEHLDISVPASVTQLQIRDSCASPRPIC